MIRSLTFRDDRGDGGRRQEVGAVGGGPAAAGSEWTDGGPVFLPGASLRLPSWYVRLLKTARRGVQRLRVLLRLRRGFRVGEIWYKELASTPMHRALQAPPRGVGFKDFRVTFPDGAKLVIRCSAREVYADLMGSVGLEHLYAVGDLIRPGTRVLELGAGSGYRASWLSGMVGPSGSVVAIGHDRVAIEYATRRYRLSNVAFEVASAQTLSGETDGSFDAAVISAVLDDTPAGNALLSETWRVLGPGGLLVMQAESGSGEAGAERAARALHDRLRAVHRSLGDSGEVPSPKVVSSLERPGGGGSIFVLAVFKPEGGGQHPGRARDVRGPSGGGDDRDGRSGPGSGRLSGA